jgi:hypothetical protein
MNIVARQAKTCTEANYKCLKKFCIKYFHIRNQRLNSITLQYYSILHKFNIVCVCNSGNYLQKYIAGLYNY